MTQLKATRRQPIDTGQLGEAGAAASDAHVGPTTLLAGPPPVQLDPSPDLWGFGGLHGGLALGLLTSAMSAHVADRQLRSVTGELHRAIRSPFGVNVTDMRPGRTVTSVSARAANDSSTALVTASAVFARSAPQESRVVTPPSPAAPPPEDCPVFTIPPEFVPFAQHTEIRPVGPARPFAGADEPELLAWLRLVGDDAPPDPVRLVVLMDSLAPSYAAILTEPVMIPTVTLTVRPAGDLTTTTSPWILLRARTVAASADGWIDEHLDAWTPDGGYLGSGQQLRLTMRANAAQRDRARSTLSTTSATSTTG